MFLRLTQVIFSFLILAILGFFLGDAWGNAAKSARIIGFDVTYLIISPLLYLVLNWHWHLRIAPQLDHINTRFIFPITAISCIILSFWDAITPPNYIFSLTRLHQSELGFAAIFSGLLALSQQSQDWWQRYYTRFIALTPYVILFILFIVSLWPFDVFARISLDDKLIENLQAIVLGIGFFTQAYYAQDYWRHGKRHAAAILTITSLFFLLLMGEEISWGQRIFNIETPSDYRALNFQGEINLHNLHQFNDLMPFAYLILAFAGSYGRWISLRARRSWAWLFPNSHYLGYFLSR